MKAGSRYYSAVSDAAVVIVRPGTDDDLRCGGRPMLTTAIATAELGSLAPDSVGEAKLGGRYEDIETGLEVLCTKGGAGLLSLGERPLTVKPTKPLPSSD